jgi:hypothetical protein
MGWPSSLPLITLANSTLAAQCETLRRATCAQVKGTYPRVPRLALPEIPRRLLILMQRSNVVASQR